MVVLCSCLPLTIIALMHDDITNFHLNMLASLGGEQDKLLCEEFMVRVLLVCEFVFFSCLTGALYIYMMVYSKYSKIAP